MKKSYAKRARTRLLLGTTAALVVSIAAAPASAQSSEKRIVDANGINLYAGEPVVETADLVIGGGEQSIAYEAVLRDGGWGSDLGGGIFSSGSTYYVTLGGKTEEFSLVGGVYTPVVNRGSTLSFDSSSKVFTYILSDGTTAHYDRSKSSTTALADGLVTDIRRPDGRSFTFSYEGAVFCQSSKASSTGDICLKTANVYRLSGVGSNDRRSAVLSYSVDYTYDPMNPATVPGPDWSQPSRVTLSNDAIPGSVAQEYTETPGSAGETLKKITDSKGRVTTYRMMGTHLRGIMRPGQSAEDITFTWTNNRVSSVTSQARGTTNYSVSDANGVRSVVATDSLNRATTYKFDLPSQWLSSTTNARGDTTSFQYDSAGRLQQVSLPEGNAIRNAFDARGNVIESRQVAKPGSGLPDIVAASSYPSGCTNEPGCNQPLWTRDARGNQTDYTYDPATGDVLTITEPMASNGVRPQTRYTYTSPNGVSVLSTISKCMTLASCAGTADEVKTVYSNYTPNNLPATVSTGAGNQSVWAVTNYTYDAIGNVTSVDGPLPGPEDTVYYRYDQERNVTGIIMPDPDGSGPRLRRAQRVTYNSDDQVTLTEEGTVSLPGSDPNAWTGFVAVAQTENSFDGQGRPIRHAYVAGGTTYNVAQVEYDALGRLRCSTVRMNAAAFASAPAACTQGPLGASGPDRITAFDYDLLDRAYRVTAGYGTSAPVYERTASYTADGQIASLADGENNLTRYAYDGYDRLALTYFPVATKGAATSSGSDYEQLGYDPTGNVVSRRLRDGTLVTLTYDMLNRLSSRTVPGEQTTDFSFDLVGQLRAAQNPGASVTFAYDGLGRRTSETQPFGSLSWQYDAAGHRKQMSWSDGFFVGYDYDMAGNMTAIRENGALSGPGVLATYAYDSLNRRTGVTYGNLTTRSFAYDPASRLQSLALDLGGTTRDVTTTFAYNPASQISSRSHSNDSYAWPGAVNLDRPYVTNGLNQYSSAGSVGFTHDARGNLATSGSSSYGYDKFDQLRSGPGVTLNYDPLGRLMEVNAAGSTRFLSDGGEIAAEVANPSGAILRRYVTGPGFDEPIVWYEGATTADRRFLAADERGSIIAVTDSNGNSIATNSYDEFGIPASGNIGRFQYTGQAWLPELGMSYYKARIYSPTLGRFLQTDPIGYADGMNWYNYVGGDPVNATDPSGLKMVLECLEIGALTICKYVDDDEIVVTGIRLPMILAGVNVSGVGGVGTPYREAAGSSRPADFCGSKGTEVFPDSLGGADISGPCYFHDECYAHQEGQNKCDRDLLDGILDECKRQKAKFGCYQGAVTYYMGLRLFGILAYRRAGRKGN